MIIVPNPAPLKVRSWMSADWISLRRSGSDGSPDLNVLLMAAFVRLTKDKVSPLKEDLGNVVVAWVFAIWENFCRWR